MLSDKQKTNILGLFQVLRELGVNPDWVRRAEAIPLSVYSEPDVWLSLGSALRRTGDYQGAQEVYKVAVEIHQASEKMWTNYAILLLNWGRLGDALEACERALALVATEERAISTKARIHELLHNYPDALRLYHQALALDPTSPLLHTNIGCCHLGLADEELAIASFQRAVELCPDYTNALFNLHGRRVSPLESK
jgi:tetratricopeptide (TPR) repeat protein